MADLNYRVTAIKLENFMGFKDSGWLELRPITLLFGRNSSGKSAIIRALLMLKQSLGRRTSVAPLVLSGELVDLGTFYTMVRGHNPKLPVSFSFKIERRGQRESTDNLSIDEQHLAEEKQIQNTPSWMKDAILSQHDVAVLRLAYTGANSDIRLVSIGVYESNSQEDQLIFRAIRRNSEWEYEVGKDSKGNQRMSNVPMFIQKERRDQSGKIQFENSSLGEFAPFAYQLVWQYADFEHLPAMYSLTNRTNRDVSFVPFLTLKDGIGSPVDKDVHKDWRIVSDALDFFRQHIFTFLEDIVYLKPLRDEARRYYPADSEWVRALLDPNSQELTIVNKRLASIGLNVTADAKPLDPNEGIVSVYLHEQDDKGGELQINLRDVGVGVSQVLPVIVKSLQAGKNGLVIIEQPELHLHPAAQAELADLFISLAHTGVNFVLETHSANIIYRLRRRLAETAAGRFAKDSEQSLSSDLLATYFIERKFDDKLKAWLSTCEQITFNSTGAYINQPEGFVGFFGSDTEELMAMKTARLEAIENAEESAP